MPHFVGTEYETRTCPRRHLIRNPDVSAIFAVHNDVGDDGIGVDGAARLTPAVVEGLSVVADAIAHRRKDQAEVERIEAAVRNALKGGADG